MGEIQMKRKLERNVSLDLLKIIGIFCNQQYAKLDAILNWNREENQ